MFQRFFSTYKHIQMYFIFLSYETGSLLYLATFCFLHSGNPCPAMYPPYPYSILRGCQSLLGFTASRELLRPPIILAALGDEGDGSPTSLGYCHSLGLHQQATSPCLLRNTPQSQNLQRCSALISQRGSTCFRTHLLCWSR